MPSRPGPPRCVIVNSIDQKRRRCIPPNAKVGCQLVITAAVEARREPGQIESVAVVRGRFSFPRMISPPISSRSWSGCAICHHVDALLRGCENQRDIQTAGFDSSTTMPLCRTVRSLSQNPQLVASRRKQGDSYSPAWSLITPRSNPVSRFFAVQRPGYGTSRRVENRTRMLPSAAPVCAIMGTKEEAREPEAFACSSRVRNGFDMVA